MRSVSTYFAVVPPALDGLRRRPLPDGLTVDRLARAVCGAGCLPRKELFEAWEVARRARRLFRGGRVVDLAAGHGLLALTMLLLDDSSASGIAVDTVETPSYGRVHEAVVSTCRASPAGSRSSERPSTPFHFAAGDVIVSSHACGKLSDRVLDRAIHARGEGRNTAVLPRPRGG